MAARPPVLRNLTRDSAYVLAGSLLQLVVSLGTGVVIARALGPVGKGEVFLVLQVAALGSIVCGLGLGSSYQYHVRKGLVELPVALSHVFVQLAIITFLCGAAYLVGRPLLRFATRGALGDDLLLVGLALVVLSTGVQYLGFLLMALRDGVRQSSVFGMLGGCIYLGLVLGLVLGARWGVAGALLANAAGLAARVVLAAKVAGRGTWRALRVPTIGAWRTLVPYGLGSLAGTLMMSSVLRLDTFLVNGMMDVRAVGVYSVAVTVGELLLMLPSAVGVALFPHLTSASEEEQVATTCRVARASLAVATVAMLFVGALGYPAIILVFGDEFAGAYAPLLWLLPGLLALTVAYSYANFFSSRGRPAINAVVFGAATVINVVANVVLIPLLGISGAALASTVAYFAVAGLFVVWISRTEGVAIAALAIPRTEDWRLIWVRLRRFGRVAA